MKILLIQLRRLGDILLTTPVIPYLKESIPTAEIDFLCELDGELVPVEVKWQNEVNKAVAIHLKKFGKGFIITKDTLDIFGSVMAVPAFVFLAMIGKTMVKRKVL